MQKNSRIRSLYYLVVIFFVSSWTIISCHSEQHSTLSIRFAAAFMGEEIACDQNFQIPHSEAAAAQTETQWQWQNIQFFIHQIRLFDQHGEELRSQLITEPGKHPEIQLIGGVCGQAQHWQMQAKLAKADIEKIAAIEFTLGVPFAENHLNPLTQKAPLNQSDMFWVWQTGHKFLRLELSGRRNEQTQLDWLLHLGSTGCSSVAAVRAPEKECLHPNRITYRLNWQANEAILIDFAKLIPADKAHLPINCQSSPDDSDCPYWLSRIGVDSSEQSLFTSGANQKQ